MKHIVITKDREIFVDDLQWGTIHRHHHGSHGTSYTFRQRGSAGPDIMRNGKKTVRVWSDKHHKRDPVGSTLEGRLLSEICSLVQEELLVHPDDALAKTYREHAAYEEKRRKQAQIENAVFRSQAAAAIDLVKFTDMEQYEKVVAAVIAAMRWAQTQ